MVATADGVNDSLQNEIPVVAVPTSVQLPWPPNDPLVGMDVKLTVPIGELPPPETVSVTVAVHAVALPVTTDNGEHTQPSSTSDRQR